ncbi:protein FAR1-RELATED SEQUENCE 5-like [Diospyros lotus]|uniref:protein FAR1-RELATED SEQUENCE 5-like n=1 Tax=Diospyros lotus TaxID=55363 RepID=UPI002252959D|nr:protein FAR1-RELATED SEQUENCE 5-like [Diospyros lotus]
MVNKGNEIFEIEDDEHLGESDNVRIMDDVNTLDDELLGEDGGPLVPKVGMKFNDENAVFDFYKSYAYDIGFLVRKRNSKKGDDSVVNIDLDEEARLKIVFWADNRCREAYKEFGDVVTFDTTYLTNKYDMMFAPFVGVNHHDQSTLFGCGLVSNEDTKTFVWLFRTWLQCMHGQAPTGIITDQDRAMQNAIQIVFPNTKHRWCLWHILKKLPEKFGNHVHKGSIHLAIHEVVYESQTPEEFEQGWTSMINTYTLHENEWLSGLYIERNRWVPCFLKTSFWARMSTTQRSESMNAFFDGYVNSRTSLKQFVEQYERALKSQVEKEFHADFRSFSQTVPCASRYEMEKQLQSVYTISKFRECQEEFT